MKQKGLPMKYSNIVKGVPIYDNVSWINCRWVKGVWNCEIHNQNGEHIENRRQLALRNINGNTEIFGDDKAVITMRNWDIYGELPTSDKTPKQRIKVLVHPQHLEIIGEWL